MLKIFQVDAFTNQLFGGNPAAIIPLKVWLPTEKMQDIAEENNLAETAFIIPTNNNVSDYHIRWFTPKIEVKLCGHATLAAAHVLFAHLNYNKKIINFHSLSGILSVRKENHNTYTLDFPSDTLREPKLLDKRLIQKILNIKPINILRGNDDFMAVLETQSDVLNAKPDLNLLKSLSARGLIITARGESVDFVSRCFYPAAGIDEDPVTGSAHTTMTPYWAEILNKKTLSAHQLSLRKGELTCTLKDSRVEMTGSAVTYMVGEVFL